MKVALIVPGFSADADDWCIPVLVDVVRELSTHAEVHVFALRYPKRCDRYRVHGVQVQTFGGDNARGVGRAGLLARAWLRLVTEHRRQRFDVVHGLWADEPGFLAVQVGQFCRIPALVSVMGGELVALTDIGYGGHLSRLNRYLSAVALHQAVCVTAGCSQSLEQARRRCRDRHQGGNPHPVVPDTRFVRLPWGIDPTLFAGAAPRLDLAGTFRVLHVASLVPVKDQTTLLRAIARLKEGEPGVHLHIVGDGPLRTELCNQVAALGLAGSVTFHGHVARQELAAFYQAADVVAVSSRHEAQLVVAVEAAFCGLPVVGTAVGLVADFAGAPSGPAAVAVPVGDDVRLAEALRSLVPSDHRRALGQAAHVRARTEYLASHTAAGLMELYSAASEQAVSRQPGGAYCIRPIVSPSVPSTEYQVRRGVLHASRYSVPGTRYLERSANEVSEHDQPLVTIFINTYNYARYLARAIDSALCQRYPRSQLDILVVDDGSTDDTAAVAQCYADRIRFITKPHGGQASALNLGFREARGNIVCLMDGDDYFLPDKVRLVVDAIRDHPDVGLIYNEFDIVDNAGRSLDKRLPEPTWTGLRIPLSRVPAQLRSLILLGHPWTAVTSALSVRRSVVQDLEVPEDVFPHSPDLFLGLVLPFMTEVAIIESAATAYVYHGENVGLFQSSARNREMYEQQLACIRRAIEQRTGTHFLTYLGRSIYGPEPQRSKMGLFRLATYVRELQQIQAANVDGVVKRRSRMKLTASLLLPPPAYEGVRQAKALTSRWRARAFRRRLREIAVSR